MLYRIALDRAENDGDDDDGRDAAQFKSALARQDFSSWHSNPVNPQPAQSGESSNAKKKRPKSSTSLPSRP
jgi:hypothetical protein